METKSKKAVIVDHQKMHIQPQNNTAFYRRMFAVKVAWLTLQRKSGDKPDNTGRED